MFKRIMIPVDLTHRDRMERALDVATGLARDHGASLLLVSVGGDQPSETGHNPAEFRAALSKLAQDLATQTGLSVDAEALISPDPAVSMADDLMDCADRSGSDLIVMATHLPGVMDHLFTAHGAQVARHAKMSVMLVR